MTPTPIPTVTRTFSPLPPHCVANTYAQRDSDADR
jgi:hypothetical protein